MNRHSRKRLWLEIEAYLAFWEAVTIQDALRAAESVREHDKQRFKRLLDEAAREDAAIRRGEVLNAPRR